MAEAETSSTSDASDAVRGIEEALAMLLREAVDLKNLLMPYTRKRSLLVLSGHSEVQKLRDAASTAVGILDKLATFAQVAATLPHMKANFDESDISKLGTLIPVIQRCAPSFLHVERGDSSMNAVSGLAGLSEQVKTRIKSTSLLDVFTEFNQALSDLFEVRVSRLAS